ncbi:acyl-CoA dehydrogenase family protein, partial [Streptomyces xiaopingdaonensis]|uniref:acyl-CoA dehydrogenase family protein n=1 Tax=Streptomyces xiaopingdaonensis TaxID=1565415 RepID=UPI00035E61C0
MTIGLTEEHRALRDSVRGWAARHVPRTEVRAAFDAERERTPAWWRPLAEQGLLGLHLPEKCGGSGYGLVELAVVLEELGRALAPGPFLPTVLASAVLHEAGRDDLLPPLADGSRTAALALDPGTLALTRRPDGRAVLAGESAPVLGGHVADLVVLPFHEEGQPGWAVAPRAALAADDLASHDATRRLSRFRAEDLVLEEPDVLGVLAPRRPYDLAAALFAAEASGLADLNTSVAAEHARVRTQFGRPIGQFQGVKHRCSRMLARAEQARACAWDAARALTPGSGADAQEAGLAAATAAATAVDAAFTTAKDAVQTLGGIGFTWEHDAHLVLRRAHTLRLLLGPGAGWHRRIAALTLEGARRDLGVELPAEAAPMRAEVRRTLAPARKLPEAERRTYLADHGFTAP